MTPAISGRAGLGAGEVFVELDEKKQLPGFCFLGGAGLAPGGAKRRGFAEEVPKLSALEDQKLTSCDRLTRNRESKWKSWVNSQLGRDTSRFCFLCGSDKQVYNRLLRSLLMELRTPVMAGCCLLAFLLNSIVSAQTGPGSQPTRYQAQYTRIYFDDIESLAPTLGAGFVLDTAGTLTSDPSEVISGRYSIKGAYFGSSSYTSYLHTDPA